MCNDSANVFSQTPLSAEIPGTTQTASGKCCWCKDYSREVSATANGKYFDLAESPGKLGKFAAVRVKYKSFCRLKSREILVEVRFKLARVGVEKDGMDQAWGKMLGANRRWGSKARMVIDDPERGISKLPINLSVVEDDKSPHRTFEIVLDTDTPNAQDLKVQVNRNSSAWTMAH